VRIYHPHGFLPHPDLRLDGSDFVILSLKSINLRLGKPHDEWIALLRHILSSGVGLFIGLSEHSFRDRALAPLLALASTQLEGRRPTGFWVLKTDEAQRDQLNKEFLDYNIVPLRQCERQRKHTVDWLTQYPDSLSSPSLPARDAKIASGPLLERERETPGRMT
jgi:hypothetical protein